MWSDGEMRTCICMSIELANVDFVLDAAKTAAGALGAAPGEEEMLL